MDISTGYGDTPSFCDTTRPIGASSAADAEHIVGELMKSFRKKRPADARIQESLTQMFGETGRILGETLEGGLPAISLCSHVSLKSAVANDTDPSNIYAQQLFSLGRAGDCLIAISTSGNAENCVRAAMIAKPGQCVLLSPASSSFDAFSGYEERGEKFEEIVKSLEGDRAGAVADVG